MRGFKMTLLEALYRRVIADSVKQRKEQNAKQTAKSEKFVWDNLLYASI